MCGRRGGKGCRVCGCVYVCFPAPTSPSVFLPACVCVCCKMGKTFRQEMLGKRGKESVKKGRSKGRREGGKETGKREVKIKDRKERGREKEK